MITRETMRGWARRRNSRHDALEGLSEAIIAMLVSHGNVAVTECFVDLETAMSMGIPVFSEQERIRVVGHIICPKKHDADSVMEFIKKRRMDERFVGFLDNILDYDPNMMEAIIFNN